MGTFNFVIRDALATDIDACLNIDHSYDSDYVWRTVVNTTPNGYQIAFRKERLPRTNTITHSADDMRLRLALPKENCFLVAVGKDEPIVVGYLTLRPDPIHKIAVVQDIVVDKDFRQAGIGSRLLTIARTWSSEHGAKQLMVEVPTVNYPAIEFLQNRGLTFCGYNDQYFRNHDISVFFGRTLH